MTNSCQIHLQMRPSWSSYLSLYGNSLLCQSQVHADGFSMGTAGYYTKTAKKVFKSLVWVLLGRLTITWTHARQLHWLLSFSRDDVFLL